MSVKISIIVATLNSDEYIRDCIQSILSQTYRDIQVIVKDGGSTDSTLSILEEFGEKVELIVSQDTGVYEAWNQALDKVRGEWIVFVGSDDVYVHPYVVEEQVAVLLSIKQPVDFVYGDVEICDSYLRKCTIKKSVWQEAKKSISRCMTVNHAGAFHRAAFLKKSGGFSASFRVAGDYEFVLRCAQNRSIGYFESLGPILKMRDGGLSRSPSLSLVTELEVWRAQRMHGRLLPHWRWVLRFGKKALLFMFCFWKRI